ncbi:hypothetical protein L3X38_001929 [Prunus dulcis]|uniref:Integrase catalytic domain-containing protein n=1 Tax=Prunus dulcis TaxID=3755 RepID=A0AAD4ZJH2_PRUDU|nr:hypothetical protein L3X38_001929 [Prunus dulcis]
MAGSSMSELCAPIFNGSNYDFWRIKMCTIFKSHKLWDLVENGYEQSVKKEEGEDLTAAQRLVLEENVAKDAKALGLIQNAVSDDIFPRIALKESAKEAWEILQQEFRGDKKVRSVKLQALRREFEYTRMHDDESLSGYVTKLLELVNQMKAYGEELTEQRIVQKLLISLSREYDSIAEVIEETKDTETIGVQEVIGSLKSHEQRLQRHNERVTEKAFSSLNVSSKDQSNTGQAGGSKSKKNWKSQKGKKWDSKSENNSKKESKDCKGKPEAANYASHKEEEGNMFYACHAAEIVKNNGVWYVDSACSNHMTSQASLLVNIDTKVTAKVKMGTGDLVDATGKGTLVIDTKAGPRHIKEVMLVPGLDENLLSVGQMVEHGYYLVFGDSMVEIFDDRSMENLLAKVSMTRNRCFPLSLKYANSVAMKATIEESTWYWHRRFGHLNMQSLKLLQQQELVYGLPEIGNANRICQVCAIGKSHREAFGKEKIWRASLPLELVHSDVCGPMQTPSIGGNKYFLTFIDDCTRMCWVYFMQFKSEVFNIFKKFKAMVELQSGYKLKKLRSDRGGEYTSAEFLQFCEEIGLERQLTMAYSPQQNGVAERKNRTIVEMSKTMMKEKKLPYKFWGEAVNTTVYIRNRCPTKALDNVTPFEAFSGRKPGVKHLKVFGSICFCHVPNQLRSKLEDAAVKCIFVGYGKCEKGYKVYNLQTNKITTSRSVIFDENSLWDWETQTVDTVTVQMRSEDTSRSNEEEHEETMIDIPCPPQVTTAATNVASPSDSPSSTPVKLRDITEIYARCNMSIIEPENFAEASKDKAWKKAMEAEMDMIEKNETWKLVDRPSDKPVIGVKWVYKTKLNLDGSIQKHKARLVVKGYAQKPGIDFNETFAPVARVDTIRTLIALAAQKGWKLYQLDVKSAFLNGVLKEEVYVDQSDGFVTTNYEDKVYKLKKALYGLKQAPRAWYEEINAYLVSCGYVRSTSEATLYCKTKEDSGTLIVSIYVDDIVYTGSSEELIDEFKTEMMRRYEMTDLGLLYHFLGMAVIQTESCIFINQKKYALTLLDKFGLKQCKPVSTPLVATEKLCKDDGSDPADESEYRKIVGSLLYLTATRPDIMFAASLLARFMHCPTKKHYGMAKRVLRYIQGTIDFGIEYQKGKEAILIGYCDSDWGGSQDDMRSTSGYAFSFGSGVFSWASVKQHSVALSTAEAEYVSASEATTQAIWLRFVLEDFGELQTDATPLMVDNTSAIAMTRNPVFHQKTKHINRRYHFIRDALQDGVVDLRYCRSEEQVADIFTKALSKDRFNYLRGLLGVKPVNNLEGNVEM